jgi:CBS domain-containing protein
VVVYDYGQEADEARLLWGIVSDLDLAAAAAAGELDNVTAGNAAATPVWTISADDSLVRAAQLMAEHGISHLVVVDPHTERPSGVISTLDLARAFAAPEKARDDDRRRG